MSDAKMTGFQRVSGSLGKSLPKLCAVMALFLVAACGVSYTSPKVKTSDLGNVVTIVPMTPSSIAAANKSKYSPRRLRIPG